MSRATLGSCNIAKDKEFEPRVSRKAKRKAPMTRREVSEKG